MIRYRKIHMPEAKWLAACAALGIGEYCGFRFQHLSPLWTVSCAASVFCFLFGFGFGVRFWPLLALALLGFSLAFAKTEARRKVIESALLHSSGKPFSMIVTPSEDAKKRTTAKGATLTEFPADAGPLRVMVKAVARDGGPAPKAGETWLCKGWLSGWKDSDTMMRRDFRVAQDESGMKRLDVPQSLFRGMLDMLRSRLSSGMDNVPECFRAECALLRAMLFGERAEIAPNDKRDFTAAGAMHIFAISGLHVMIMAKIFSIAYGLTLLPSRFSCVVVVPLVWLYVAMVGAPPSATRAAIMATAYFVAPVFWRRPNGIVAWAIAFIVSHLARPETITSPGSGLSFSIMLSLVVLLRLTEGMELHPLCQTVMFSSIAWIAGVPICVRVFGHITVAGLVSGPIVVPLASVATALAAIGAIADLLTARIATYLQCVAAIIMRLIAALAHLLAQVPGGDIAVCPWTLAECVAWYAAMAAGLWLFSSVHFRRVTMV